MVELTPREIRDKIAGKEITPEEGKEMFEKVRVSKVEKGIVITEESKLEKLREGLDKLNRMGTGGDIFVSGRDAAHYMQRIENAETARHITATPIYIAGGAVDGVADGVSYIITELAEDASYLVARTGTRIKRGWARGKLG